MDRLVMERIEKLKALRELGVNPYPYRFLKTHKAAEIIREFQDKLKTGEETDIEANVAGRMMTNRDMGKVGFFHLQDTTGQIQIHVRKELLNDAHEVYKKLDLGDIIGIKGTVFKTKKGEVTVLAKELQVLCKALRTPPEKFHGLKDVELRYRHRSLDLISNPESKKIFETRSKAVKAIRTFLDNHNYMEVETPILQPIYGGADAEPFTTHHNALNAKLYLRISPELYLKRLIVGGFERVYEINKNFRNEGVDTSHNPEFTMLEFYQAYADYYDMMDFIEQLFRYVFEKVLGKTQIEYQGKTLNFGKPWQRLSMTEAVKKYADINIEEMTENEIIRQVPKYKLEINGEPTKGKIIQALFEKFVEEKLTEPTFIIDHPKEVCPLTKIHRKNNEYVERFEGFIAGMELSNAYSELNDPIDQRERFKDQQRRKEEGEKETHPLDEEFLFAIETGMPPAGGVGIGIDRMIMILTNSASIRDVILFPTMKPKDHTKTNH